jgi:hypothetical protein
MKGLEVGGGGVGARTGSGVDLVPGAVPRGRGAPRAGERSVPGVDFRVGGGLCVATRGPGVVAGGATAERSTFGRCGPESFSKRVAT